MTTLLFKLRVTALLCISINAAEQSFLYKETCLNELCTKNVRTSITEDGTHCVSRTPNGTIQIYDYNSRTTKRLLLPYRVQSICASILNSSKSVLASPNHKKTIALYNLTDNNRIAEFQSIFAALDMKFAEQDTKLYAVFDSPNNHNVLVSCYDVLTQQKIIDFKGAVDCSSNDRFRKRLPLDQCAHYKDGYAPKMCVNNNNNLFLIGNDHNRVTLWDTKSSQIVSKIRLIKPHCGTTTYNYACDQDFHPNNFNFAVCGSNQIASEYDLRNIITTIKTTALPDSTPLSIKYEKDGDGLIVGGDRHVVLISNDFAQKYSFKVAKKHASIAGVYYSKQQKLMRNATNTNYCHEWDFDEIGSHIINLRQKEQSLLELEPLIDKLRAMHLSCADQPQLWTEQDQIKYDALEQKIQNIMKEKNL